MDTTTNYGLSKPGYGDSPDIEVLGQNADIVDTELKKAQDHRENSDVHMSTDEKDRLNSAIQSATFGGAAVPQNGTTLEIPMPNAGQVGASRPTLAHNGDFRVCQRGVTQSTGGMYSTVDRWSNDLWNTVGGVAYPSVQVSRYTCTDGFSGSFHYIEIKVMDVPNETGGEDFAQTMEDLDDLCPLAGKTVTLSANIWCDNDYRNLYVSYKTPDDVRHVNAVTCVKDTNKRYSVTITLPYNAKRLAYGLGMIRTLVASDVDTNTHIWDVKLELGSVATPFSPRPYAEELALCQRYYQTKICERSGWSSSSNIAAIVLELAPNMRSGITPTISGATPANLGVMCNGVEYSATNIAISGYYSDSIIFDITVSGSMPIHHPVFLTSNAGISIDAEIY